MAVLVPMPSTSVRIATAANVGCRASERNGVANIADQMSHSRRSIAGGGRAGALRIKIADLRFKIGGREAATNPGVDEMRGKLLQMAAAAASALMVPSRNAADGSPEHRAADGKTGGGGAGGACREPAIDCREIRGLARG